MYLSKREKRTLPHVQALQRRAMDTIRVLHIDDDDYQKTFLKIFLEEDNRIKISSVSQASDLIDLAKTGIFDCIISDYDMPEMNGIELAILVRQVSKIPLILYTGRGSEEIAQRAFEVGIDDYIRKEDSPAHYQVLKKRVIQAVERRRSNEEYKNLFDSAADAIYIHDYQGNIFDVNKCACERLGYQKEELLNMNVSQISPPGKDSKGFKYLIKEFEKKERAIFESSSLAKDGRIIPVEVSAISVKFAGTDAILSFCRDITERKRLEAELNSRIKLLHNHVTELMLKGSLDEIARCSFNLLEKIGLFGIISIGFVEGDQIRLRYSTNEYAISTSFPLNKGGVMSSVVRTGQTRLISDSRLVSIYSAIKTRHLSELAVPVFLNGKVVAVINLEHDEPDWYNSRDQMMVEVLAQHISLAMSELQRREVEGRFRILFEKSPFAMNMVRLHDGLQIDVNESALNLFGLTRDEVIGKTMRELNLFRNDNDWLKFVKEFRKNGHVENFEVDLISKKRGIIRVIAASDRLKINGVDYILNTILDARTR